jgi:hypothetical protein
MVAGRLSINKNPGAKAGASVCHEEIATSTADISIVKECSPSALPPKADMCGALAYVCFGPIADIVSSSTSPREETDVAWEPLSLGVALWLNPP